MATHNQKRGWQWTDEERQARKPKLRHLQNAESKVALQVHRIHRHLAQFSKPAGEALESLKMGLAPLKDLDIRNRGRKYQPISPEEADRIFEAVESMLKPWHDLTTSPDFVAAVRATNRDIRRANAQIREHNKAARAAYDAMAEKLDEALRQCDQGDFGGALDLAANHGLL